MHEVIAAITTWPWSSSVSVPSASVTCDGRLDAVGDLRAAGARAGVLVRVARIVAVRRRWWRAGRRRGSDSALGLVLAGRPRSSGRKPSSAIRNDALDSVSETRSCGRFGPGQRRDDLAEVELERLGVGRLLGVLVVPQALLARVGLDELDALLRAPGELEVAQRLGVDREDRAGRAELRATCCRSSRGRPAAGSGRRGRRTRRTCRRRRARAASAVTVSTRSVAVAPSGSSPCELEADHARDQHRHRLAEHRGLGLDAADAPAEHAEAVDHRRVRVGADERVGVACTAVVRVSSSEDHAREVLEVDLVDDAGVRRDDLEVLEGALAPAQERVALLVALELHLGVDAEGVARAEDVDLHGVVDDQLGRDERVDLRRVAAEVGHRVAHRGEVDDARARR